MVYVCYLEDEMKYRKGDKLPGRNPYDDERALGDSDAEFGCDCELMPFGDGYCLMPLAKLRPGECLIKGRTIEDIPPWVRDISLQAVSDGYVAPQEHNGE